MAKAPHPNYYWSASVVHLVKMEFCKKSFGERSNSSSERARRGEEDGMVVGGQGGVCGGGDGGESGGGNGLFWWIMEEEDGIVDGVMVVVVVGMEKEMEEKVVEVLVVKEVGRVAGQEGGIAQTHGNGLCWFVFWKEKERKKNE